jgi:hypothetical protein
MIMSERKDNLLILPKSLFRVDKAEPGIKRGMGKLWSRIGHLVAYWIIN